MTTTPRPHGQAQPVRTVLRRRRSRLTAALATVALATLVLSGCSGAPDRAGASDAPGTAGHATGGSTRAPSDRAVPNRPTTGTHVVSGDAAAVALATSRGFFASSPAVVILSAASGGAPTDRTTTAVHRAAALGVPLLVAEDAADGPVHAELDRLGAATVVTVGEVPAELTDGRTVIDGTDADAHLPDVHRAAAQPGFALVIGPAEKQYGSLPATVAAANADAVGAPAHRMSGRDPRQPTTRSFLVQHADADTYAVGQLGPTDEFTAMAATAAAGPELPGGGQLIFPDRRMVALYGTPGTPGLGALGEQDADAAVRRVRQLADQYRPYSDERVQPAFEMIATVASGEAGPDGTYSSMRPVDTLEPWVEAAARAGVYVVLDLQPGRADFLTQAKAYASLLSRPNVGIAYDPEWRLRADQRPLEQIGTVDAAELNRANDWLADLTRRHRLPQKLVILHQFQPAMISDRAHLDTGHPELSLLVHADGNGVPGEKMATWNALKTDLPTGIRLGWKNFYDEDTPTFSPRQTYEDVQPKPWFVSYQ